ncbi:MAG: bifunctional DNA-formamidopyrimidine glycosylase/DNA-(apurinic or apyrimidinic site) lyase [Mariprofundales bacterium]
MPELPEVETVCRGLATPITGRTIIKVSISGKRLRLPWPVNFCHRLQGRTIHAVARRAKYLLIDICQGETLIWHLGMSGCLRLLGENDVTPKHQHALLTLDNHMNLSFDDPRRFGLVDLWPSDQLTHHPSLHALGPEPLSESFHPKYLQQQLVSRRSAIKPLLLDSRLVAGIGNIYANEALFEARISPFEPGCRLSSTQCVRLVTAIRDVLLRAIEAGGSTINDFVGADGKPGYFAHQFRCYGREGAGCSHCQQPIHRLQQAGRSTFYCPSCQQQ